MSASWQQIYLVYHMMMSAVSGLIFVVYGFEGAYLCCVFFFFVFFLLFPVSVACLGIAVLQWVLQKCLKGIKGTYPFNQTNERQVTGIWWSAPLMQLLIVPGAKSNCRSSGLVKTYLENIKSNSQFSALYEGSMSCNFRCSLNMIQAQSAFQGYQH